jgi:hypothetical protein
MRPSRASRAPRDRWESKWWRKAQIAFRAQRPSHAEGLCVFDAGRSRRRNSPSLLGRGRREHFALLAGLWFGLRFRGFLGLFPAFVFASHACKHDIKAPHSERSNRAPAPPPQHPRTPATPLRPSLGSPCSPPFRANSTKTSWTPAQVVCTISLRSLVRIGKSSHIRPVSP